MSAVTLTLPSAIFTQAPDAVVIAVYTALHTFRDWQKGTCFPSQKTIAKMIGRSPSTVSRCLHKLARLGLIRLEHRRRPNGSNTSCQYDLNPAWPKVAPLHARMQHPLAPMQHRDSSHSESPSKPIKKESERESRIALSDFDCKGLREEINARRQRLGEPPLQERDFERVKAVAEAKHGGRKLAGHWRSLLLRWGLCERRVSRESAPQGGSSGPSTTPAKTPAQLMLESWQRIVADWRQTGIWYRDLQGPAPGERGCQVPAEALA